VFFLRHLSFHFFFPDILVVFWTQAEFLLDHLEQTPLAYTEDHRESPLDTGTLSLPTDNLNLF